MRNPRRIAVVPNSYGFLSDHGPWFYRHWPCRDGAGNPTLAEAGGNAPLGAYTGTVSGEELWANPANGMTAPAAADGGWRIPAEVSARMDLTIPGITVLTAWSGLTAATLATVNTIMCFGSVNTNATSEAADGFFSAEIGFTGANLPYYRFRHRPRSVSDASLESIQTATGPAVTFESNGTAFRPAFGAWMLVSDGAAVTYAIYTGVSNLLTAVASGSLSVGAAGPMKIERNLENMGVIGANGADISAGTLITTIALGDGSSGARIHSLQFLQGRTADGVTTQQALNFINQSFKFPGAYPRVLG